MKKLTFAVCGVGNRGTVYSRLLSQKPEEAEVVAIADPRREFIDRANTFLNLPEERIFSSGEEMLAAEKLADIMLITTQDAQHKEHAIAALEKGYDLILEKPIANKLEDCFAIEETARRLGRRVLICHVLRYAPFYRSIKDAIVRGDIGRIESIEAIEAVGCHHMAHSYVRGNWHKKETSCPMVVAKCCHDMDLFLWLSDKKVKRISSFGSLDEFRKENCPPDAADRCLDCPRKDCTYNAVNYYLSRMPRWPSNVVCSNPTKENILEALRTSDYGRCVYKMDNDVVDHQAMLMELEDGVTVSFQMIGFSAIGDRRIRVMGTKGEIYGNLRDAKYTFHEFGKDPVTVDVSNDPRLMSGHSGGDLGLIEDALKYFRNDTFDRTSITELSESVASHRLAFAAERSRLDGGALIDPNSDFSLENL